MVKEGWFFPKTKRVRVYHYGIEGRRRSLCGRFDTPGPHLLFPEVSHQKCLACDRRLEERNRRRLEDKATLLEYKVDIAIEALRKPIYDLLSLFEFDRVEGILEEIENLSSRARQDNRPVH